MQQESRAISRRGAVRRLGLSLGLGLIVAACAHTAQADEDPQEPDPRDPILIHVKNENFLDVNVSVSANGVTRRLGTVSGNGTGEFKVPYRDASTYGMVLIAAPIGGRGAASSGTLNLGPGQEVDFKISSNLRQSTAVVRAPQ